MRTSRHARPSLAAFSLLLTSLAFAQVNVTTYHNDNSRSGQNTSETTLTNANVGVPGKFDQIFSVPVDGQIYAQPLVLSNVSIGGGTHTVVYVATENDSIYAIDASSGTIYWHKSLGTAVSSGTIGCSDISPEYGITGTPVINASTGVIYVMAQTTGPAYQLHALNASTAAEEYGGPVTVSASIDGITFEASQQHIRPALLLENGHIIFGSGSHCDNGTWYGWVMSYNATTLKQEAVFNTEPTGHCAGVWMSGNGVAADSSGNLYFATGNSTTGESGTDLGDSIVKLGPPTSSFSVLSYFTPSEGYLLSQDMDVGSGGVLLIPNTSLLIQMGKPGQLYLVNETNMGGYCKSCDGDDTNIVQEIQGASVGLWGSPAYWNDNVYFGSAREEDYLGGATADTMKAYSFNSGGSGKLSTGPTSTTGEAFAWPPPTPSLSANGTTNGIVWALDNSNPSLQTLYAHEATNLSDFLYSSNDIPCDALGAPVKFAVPTVANGKVYVGGASSLTAFGLPSPNFCFWVTPTSATIMWPGGTQFDLNTYPVGGFTGTVTFNAVCPSNLVCTVSDGDLEVRAENDEPGTFTIPITAASGSIQHNASIQVTVSN